MICPCKWSDASLRFRRISSATWSLRLRPVCRCHASIAHAGGQSLLHKGVHILGIGVDLQRAAVQIVQNGLQALVNIVHILLGDDALLAQHSRVYHAAVDILFDHPRIKADGRVKVVHAAVHRFAGTSLPKLGHKKTSGVIVMNRE